ncbi:MAG: ABC transporter ATP-binding protein [Cyanobacteria bacterium J06629_2]
MAIILVACIKAFLGFQIQKYIFEFGFSQQADLRSRLMRSYLRVPYIFHLGRNSAFLVQIVVVEAERFANAVLMPVLFSFSNFAIIIALVLLLFRTDLVATISILFVVLTLFFFLYTFKDKIAAWGKQGHNSNVEMIRVINHSLGSLKETRVIGCEAYFEAQMDEQSQRFKDSLASFHALSLLPRYTLESSLIIFIVSFAISYLLSGKSPEALTATLSVFGVASMRLLPAASNVMQSLGTIKNASYVVDKLYLDLRDLESYDKAKKTEVTFEAASEVVSEVAFEASFKDGCRTAVPFLNSIALENVRYQYPETAEASLKSISLNIKKGESIGLIGKSGAGKTTLVEVILGLLSPEGGDIKIDGVSVLDDFRSWQQLIGYIPQSIFLIDSSIEENIAFGVPKAMIDRQRLEKSIRAAQLEELIERLPKGLETAVGERGVLLSGGQRQRIGIARALYHEREVLVLDEATAALDNETEKRVTEAITSLSGTKTMILIAHRLTTLKHCDRIYLMEKGRIVKSGSYEEMVLGDYAIAPR